MCIICEIQFTIEELQSFFKVCIFYLLSAGSPSVNCVSLTQASWLVCVSCVSRVSCVSCVSRGRLPCDFPSPPQEHRRSHRKHYKLQWHHTGSECLETLWWLWEARKGELPAKYTIKLSRPQTPFRKIKSFPLCLSPFWKSSLLKHAKFLPNWMELFFNWGLAWEFRIHAGSLHHSVHSGMTPLRRNVVCFASVLSPRVTNTRVWHFKRPKVTHKITSSTFYLWILHSTYQFYPWKWKFTVHFFFLFCL